MRRPYAAIISLPSHPLLSLQGYVLLSSTRSGQDNALFRRTSAEASAGPEGAGVVIVVSRALVVVLVSKLVDPSEPRKAKARSKQTAHLLPARGQAPIRLHTTPLEIFRFHESGLGEACKILSPLYFLLSSGPKQTTIRKI